MNLFEDICPLFNIAIAIIAIADLRFVAWRDILKAAAEVDKKKNDPKQGEEGEEENQQMLRIRIILASFQEGTAPVSAEQALLLELKECIKKVTTSNDNTMTEIKKNNMMLFGQDFEMAIATLLLPQTMTQLLDSFQWYREKSREFRSFLMRTGGADFYASMCEELKNLEMVSSLGGEGNTTTTTTASARRKRSTKTTATPAAAVSSPLITLVSCNNYTVDTGPLGKELIYMIFLDKFQERIIVTFRGSITLSDWAHDVRVNAQSMNNPFYEHQPKKKQQASGGGSDVISSSGVSGSLLQDQQLETLHIHSGFYQYLCMPTASGRSSTLEGSKFDQVLRKLHELLKQNPTYDVVVTGHSLGGAASTLFAFMATAAAASATKNQRSGGGDDDDNDYVDSKNMSERARMLLPTPNKVATLFGGAMAAQSAAAAIAEEPSSVTQENKQDDDDENDNNETKVEEEGGRMDMNREASFFHIGLPTPITVVSFGSPTVGDDGFCRAFGLLEERGILRHLRVTNEDDIVPSIPVSSIPTSLERVHMYRHTGIHLLQFSQTLPSKTCFRWCVRIMNKKNQSNDDSGAALFRISHGDRQKMKKKLDRINNSNTNMTEDVAVVAEDFADAVGGLHLRTPIHHLPSSYDKRLHRIEIYLRRLSLDQLYEEYLDLDDNNN